MLIPGYTYLRVNSVTQVTSDTHEGKHRCDLYVTGDKVEVTKVKSGTREGKHRCDLYVTGDKLEVTEVKTTRSNKHSYKRNTGNAKV